MDRNLRYFDCPYIFALFVGEFREKLYVPGTLLNQIPFFHNALKGGHFKEAKDKVFEMVEDDPKAVANVLSFVLSDYVQPIQRASQDTVSDEETETVKSYMRAFIVADKFMAEGTANRILDRLYEYNREYEVDLDLIDILGTAGLRDSNLYMFLIEEFAAEMRLATRENRVFRPSGVEWNKDSFVFENVKKEDARRLLIQLAYPEKDDAFHLDYIYTASLQCAPNALRTVSLMTQNNHLIVDKH